MLTFTRARRLSIYVGNADTHKHRALCGEILHRAHKAGLGGASTFQGILGFGHSSTVHAAPRWGLTDRTPITVHLIDDPQKICEFLAGLDDLLAGCLTVWDDVEMPVFDQASSTARADL